MIDGAKKVAEVFRTHGVAYLFIGKFGAMLYGYPDTTHQGRRGQTIVRPFVRLGWPRPKSPIMFQAGRT